ncbi:MAG: hypothetical protein J6D18_00730, partial [Erysipelotrichaceae bacterium]|nr:hypothetical protein [Erysipelotrichaceae bacterium]
DFFEIYSDEIKSSHYQGCVKSFRYFLSILVRSGKIKNKKEEYSFCMKQFSRLSAKQKAGLFFAGFRVFISAVYEKIKGK